MMGDELLLSPEITMHEEPGHITISQGEVSVEIDDDEEMSHRTPPFPYANGELSITKVTGSSRAQFTGQQRPGLKVRNDLMRPQQMNPFPPNMRPVRVRPPPLTRGGLPPMPRLKAAPGGPRVMRAPNPLAGMMNLQRQMFPPRMPSPGNGFHSLPFPNRPFPPRGQTPPNASGYRRSPGPVPNGNAQFSAGPGRSKPNFSHAPQNTPPPRPSPGIAHHMNSMPPALVKKSNGTPPPSAIKPGQLKQLSTSIPRQQKVDQTKSPSVQVRTVFVPPPMKMNKAKKSASAPNGNVEKQLSRFNSTHRATPPPLAASPLTATTTTASQITNSTVKKSSPPPLHETDYEDATIIEDEDELDDVEPDVDPTTNEVDDVEPSVDSLEQDRIIAKIDKHQVTVSITPKVAKKTPKPSISSIVPSHTITPKPMLPKVEPTVQYARRADGKGFVRKVIGKRNLRAKKKKRKPFRGANYRFDGETIKKRAAAGEISSSSSTTTTTPSAADIELDNDPSGNSHDTPAFLEYLGILRKESPKIESMQNKPSGPKAKKSFKGTGFENSSPTLTSPNSLKRRLSLSEVLTAQKKMRRDQQHSVRSSFPGSAIPGGIRPSEQKAQVEVEEKVASVTTALPRLRRRRRAAPEKQPTPVESPPLQPCVCQCENVELEEMAKKPTSGTVKCQAVECIGSNKVGCKNKVEELKLRRPNERIQGAVFCDEHVKRMHSHAMCGFCGLFCGHGIFFMCRPTKKSAPHLFHKSCYLQQSEDKTQRKCPHCDLKEQPLTVQLKMNMRQMPLTLLQISSKMTFPKNKTKKSDLILKREDVVTYKMANGKIISSEGLPEGISNEALEKILAALEDKQSLKHATRNMLIPTKAGDNVKLMQLLSLGYSPNQRLTDVENGTPLHVAAAEGHVLTVHILVQAGAELDMLDDEQNSALMLACIKGKHEVVRYLLQAGADPTLRGDDGMTCLHLATQSGFLECAHIILSQSNLPRNFLNSQDEGGWTPLVWACENKHESVIKYLLERGANPLITDAEGNISLHWAALSGSRSTCERLLNSGCDVNATNNIGETPMHIVLRQDHYECAVLFLMRGSRLDIRNRNQLTPAECMVTDNPNTKVVVKLSTTLHQMMAEASASAGGSERIVSNDISKAKEANPIQCVNSVDELGQPDDYVYIGKNCVTNAVPIDRNISKLQHCKCTDTCSSEDACHCSDLSVKSWYDEQGRLKEGFDFKEPPMIFECNEMCKCNVSICHNRVIQHGISARLQVFRTRGMGWGVRPLTNIPKGSFVCEYVGEVISDSEADTREDSYLFDLDNRDGETFCIDANKYGNIARFINHCCSPNLVPVKVFASHQDLRFPHIALFASRDIPKGEELGFDYGEKFWVIKHKYFTCHCASDKCRYHKSSIWGFLKEYYNRIGEPLPDDAKPPSSSNSSSNSSNSVKEEEKKVEAEKIKEDKKQNEVESQNESIGAKTKSGRAPSPALSTYSSSAESSKTDDSSKKRLPGRPRRSKKAVTEEKSEPK